MIALVLLFTLIIGLLCMFFFLVRKYFYLRSSLKTFGKDLQTQVGKLTESEEIAKEIFEVEKQLHSIIHTRLLELELKLPENENGQKLPNLKTELLTNNLKKMLHSTLKLIKTEHSYYSNR
jgi:hypothetical protein